MLYVPARRRMCTLRATDLDPRPFSGCSTLKNGLMKSTRTMTKIPSGPIERRGASHLPLKHNRPDLTPHSFQTELPSTSIAQSSRKSREKYLRNPHLTLPLSVPFLLARSSPSASSFNSSQQRPITSPPLICRRSTTQYPRSSSSLGASITSFRRILLQIVSPAAFMFSGPY